MVVSNYIFYDLQACFVLTKRDLKDVTKTSIPQEFSNQLFWTFNLRRQVGVYIGVKILVSIDTTGCYPGKKRGVESNSPRRSWVKHITSPAGEVSP